MFIVFCKMSCEAPSYFSKCIQIHTSNMENIGVKKDWCLLAEQMCFGGEVKHQGHSGRDENATLH